MFNLLYISVIPSLCRNNLHPNVTFYIKFIVFVFLVSNVVAPPPIAIKDITIDVVAQPLVAIKAVHWARVEPKFVCKVDGCDALYVAKYNLVQHL